MKRPVATISTLLRAREAMQRNDWREALALFNATPEDSPMSADDLKSLAWANAWTGSLNDGIKAWERAFDLYYRGGDWDGAAEAGFWVAWWLLDKGDSSVAIGWHRQLELLATQHVGSLAEGYAELIRAWGAHDRGDLHEVRRLCARGLVIADRLGSRDLSALITIQLASAEVESGQRAAGLERLDIVGAAAVGNQLDPGVAFVIYCNLIATCFAVGELKRAAEWTEAVQRWCDRQAFEGFPGICRVEHAKILGHRGLLNEAIREADRASHELEAFAAGLAGSAFYELGELWLKLGDFELAEAALSRASDCGSSPQPALALLLLARGDPGAALASIRTALDAGTWHPGDRARLLPSVVEVALAAGDVELAKESALELESVANLYGSPLLEAQALFARGLLSLHDTRQAAEALTKARDVWQGLGLVLEVARTRFLLSRVYSSQGDAVTAELERAAAVKAFEDLGLEPTNAVLTAGAVLGPSEDTVMSIHLLGGFGIRINGAAVPEESWRQARPAELVKLLAITPRHALSREELIEVMWPDLGTEEATANVYRVAHRARRAIGFADAIVLQNGWLRLCPRGRIETDLEQFESAAAAALREGGEDGCAKVIESYPAELLPEDTYLEWLTERRERVRELRLRLLKEAKRWQEIVTLEPFDEAAHRKLMQQLANQGNRAAALRQFDKLKDILASELGVEPEPATLALHTSLLQSRD